MITMANGGYVYIMSDKAGSVYYVGVTEKLAEQVQAHKSGQDPAYRQKQECTELLYYEYFVSLEDATLRKEQLSKWSRKRKDELIQFNNPKRRDLFDTIRDSDQ